MKSFILRLYDKDEVLNKLVICTGYHSLTLDDINHYTEEEAFLAGWLIAHHPMINEKTGWICPDCAIQLAKEIQNTISDNKNLKYDSGRWWDIVLGKLDNSETPLTDLIAKRENLKYDPNWWDKLPASKIRGTKPTHLILDDLEEESKTTDPEFNWYKEPLGSARDSEVTQIWDNTEQSPVLAVKNTKCKNCGNLSDNLVNDLCYACVDLPEEELSQPSKSIIPTTLTVLHPRTWQRTYNGPKTPWYYGAISKSTILQWPVPGNLTSVNIRTGGNNLTIYSLEGSNFLWDATNGLQTLP